MPSWLGWLAPKPTPITGDEKVTTPSTGTN
jgi:hypothetical protein